MKKSDRLGMRIDPADKERWEKLAAAQGMSLSAWITAWAEFGAETEERILTAHRGRLVHGDLQDL